LFQSAVRFAPKGGLRPWFVAPFGDLVQGSLKSDGFPRVAPGKKNPGEHAATVPMDDFPQMPDRLVTLSNRRKPPFSAWGKQVGGPPLDKGNRFPGVPDGRVQILRAF
jgi:hypothetical protein